MPELRAKKHHQDRMAETLREEISSMIESELSDPRISFAYVREVALMPGGKSARVFISLTGDPLAISTPSSGASQPDTSAQTTDQQTQAEADTLAGLAAARGHIRHQLMERLGKRHVPELSFLIDRSKKFQSRLDQLMDRTQKAAKRNLAKSSQAAQSTPVAKTSPAAPAPDTAKSSATPASSANISAPHASAKDA